MASDWRAEAPSRGYGRARGGRGRRILQQHYGDPPEYQRTQGGYGDPPEYQRRAGSCRGYGRGRGRGRGMPQQELGGRGDYGSDAVPHHAMSDEASSSSHGQRSKLSQQMGQITIHSHSVSPSIDSLDRPRRPGTGTSGKKCIVKANHFRAQLIRTDLELHHYDVTITPEVTSRGLNRAVMAQLVRQYQLGGKLPAYDGRKNIYTAGPLPFNSEEFEIILLDRDDGSGRPIRERRFTVGIKWAAQVDLHHLEPFLQGKQTDAPQEALQALDIVLRELPSSRHTPVGRSFYSRDEPRSLVGGLESWQGFYQSIRPTEMGLSLNLDMSSTAFIRPLPVIDFVSELLGRNVSSRPFLSDADRLEIKKALRGVKVEVTHRGTIRRKYRISGVTPKATRELEFPTDESGTIMKNVVDYFLETYGFDIQHTQLPCLEAGNAQRRPIYLPMEACKIVEGQRYSKRLDKKQVDALLEVTRQPPWKREEGIVKIVGDNAYCKDPYAIEFGIEISKELAQVNARILPAPRLKYHHSGREKDCVPKFGQWNMINKKMVNAGTVHHWICINFSDTEDEKARNFCGALADMCRTLGMKFNSKPVLPLCHVRPNSVDKVLKTQYNEAKAKLEKKQLDILIVILPNNNGSLYGDVKRICETDLGVVSQCCLTKHVSERKTPYLANVALKINVKVGGRNTVLDDAPPLVSDRPTIIFGADVTHPHPGEDSSPSIAAVVASQDWPQITKYAALVSAQDPRQELIQDLYKKWEDPVEGPVTGGMIKELLLSFRDNNDGLMPERIIFYRDGVSEGQFNQVLLSEVRAIRKAYESLEPNNHIPITFVVVQKRHHTRLFADNYRDWRYVDNKSKNILPGTVVDSGICHPTEFDFYLCSHAGIQGTSRPTHYHVLRDENNFTADQLQTLTNNLCYTYARCTRSVSIVPPAYYAHLAASRARLYIEPETSESGSMTSGGAAAASGVGGAGRSSQPPGGSGAVRPLRALKDNVKRVMFYC